MSIILGSERFCGEIEQGGKVEVRRVLEYQLGSQQETDDVTAKSRI